MQSAKILILAILLSACQLTGEQPPGTPEDPAQSQQNNQTLGSQPASEQQTLTQPTGTPEPEPRPSASPTATPEVSPLPPEPQPSASPVVSAEPINTEGPVFGEHPVLGTVIFLDGDTSNLSPENIGFPAPGPRPTPSVLISGFVYDDEKNQHIEGVTVKIHSITDDFPFEKTAKFHPNGRYYFENIPCGGIQYLLTASKNDFPDRRRTTRLQCNDLGTLLHERNRFDFGVSDNVSDSPYGSLRYALTHRPFILTNSESYGLKRDFNLNPFSFRLKFSTPMNVDSVKESLVFKIEANSKLSADTSSLDFTFFGFSGERINYLNTDFFTGQTILKADAFNLVWNDQQDELHLTLKPGYSLPTDKKLYMKYLFSFDAPIFSKSGMSRENLFFENTDSGLAHALIASFQAEERALKITQTTLLPQGLQITYNQTMAFSIDSGLVIAGGMGDRLGTPGSEVHAPAEYPGHQGNASGRNVAANYTLSITPAGSTEPRLSASWKALGGTVVYDPDDLQRRSVLLQAPVNTQPSDRQFFVAHSPVLSTALSQPLASQADSSWRMSYRLVQRNGALSEAFSTPDLGAEDLTSEAFASKLQAALNTLQPQHWQVTLNAEQTALRLHYADSSGETLGWQAQTIDFNGNGSLPISWATAPLSWQNQSPFPWFASGEKLTIEAAATIMDPAGNTLDPTARNAEAVVL